MAEDRWPEQIVSHDNTFWNEECPDYLLEFIFLDAASREERANLYLEFAHKERYERVKKLVRQINPMAEVIKNSPKRTPEIEKLLFDEYNRVRPHYLNRRKDGLRNTWYEGDLRKLAVDLKKEDEYDFFVAAYQGSVHSSALSLSQGPPVNSDVVSLMADYLAARVARVNVEYNQLSLKAAEQECLDALCKSILNAFPSGEAKTSGRE